MSKNPTVKAQFPIGKTQWNKWNDDQRTAFNEARASGVPYADAIKASEGASQTVTAKKPEPKVEAKVEKKHHGFLGAVEDVADVVSDVAETVIEVAPVVTVAKAAMKVVTKKGK